MKKSKVKSQKSKVLTALLLGALLQTGFAQAPKDTGKFSFSLKQCIDYALQNQEAMKNAVLDEAIAGAKVKEIRGIGFPQINGSIGLTNNDPLRRMFIEGTGTPSFFTGGTIIPAGEVFAVPNFFQLKAGGDAGITVNQILFSSSYLVGLQAAKTYKELSAKATEQTRIQVIEAVTKAYYMVLVNQERIKLFDKNISRLDSLLAQTRLMNKNGFVEQIDVDRIEVADNNLKTEREKFNGLLELSLLLLKFQMSLPLQADLSLTEKIGDFKVDGAVQQKSDYTNRVEYGLLKSQRRLQELDLKNYKLGNLPTIVAFANVGEFSQSPEFNYFTKQNLWYGYGMYGLSMNIPLFDGTQNIYRIKQAKLKLQKIDNDLTGFEEAVNLQMRSAGISLKNNLTALDAQKKNIALAEQVAKATKSKYKQGVGTSLEVTSAETSLLEAQTNYFNALYDALVSKVDYDKANGNIK